MCDVILTVTSTLTGENLHYEEFSGPTAWQEATAALEDWRSEPYTDSGLIYDMDDPDADTCVAEKDEEWWVRYERIADQLEENMPF